MLLTLTNKGPTPVHVVSTQGNGWSLLLDPGVQQEIESRDTTVWLIGAKPEPAKKQGKGLRGALLDKWRDWRAPARPTLHIELVNSGDKGVRIIPGTVAHERIVAAGYIAPIRLVATDYIELFELSR
jgi:hypothetical protein